MGAPTMSAWTQIAVPARLPDAVYRAEQRALSIGRVYRIYRQDGGLAAYVKHPVMTLLERFTIFADEGETQPLMGVKQRKLLQVNRCFDLFDPAGGLVATLQRRAMRSILRDRWDLIDASSQPTGSVDEVGFALARRFIKFLPHHWRIHLGGDMVAALDQRFTLVRKRVAIDLTPNRGRIDPNVAFAAAILLMHEVHSAASDIASDAAPAVDL